MQLGTHVLRHRSGDRIACFDPRTGQHGWFTAQLIAELDQDAAIHPAVAARLARLGLLAASPVDDSWVPAWHRRTLWLPRRAQAWHPVATQRTAGGWAYRAWQADPADVHWLSAVDGTRNLAELATVAGLSPAGLLHRLAPLTQRQALLVRPRPSRWRDPALEQLFAPPRPANARAAHMHDEAGGTSLSQWHQEEITDGSTHFDDRETTVAHALALPHAGLRQRPYGVALAHALMREGALSADTDVVEVGCGTGELARDASPLARSWTRVDLSPALLTHQAKTAPGTQGILADATRLPFADNTIALLVSNEVLADLPAVLQPSAAAHIERYGLKPLPDGAPYNLGAMQLVEQTARVLCPGGAAWLSEFGDEQEVPTETEQLDHPEVSIHFGHLQTVAEQLGLEAQIVPLVDFLDLDEQAVQLSRASWEALRALAHHDGIHLQARAWTPQNLPGVWPEPLGNLHWVTLGEEGPGPLARRFACLWLRKPLH